MKITPLKIGNLTIDIPLVLAPMAGYTDTAFRAICRRYHCGLVFTEVVTAEGALRYQPRTMQYLASAPEERPVGVQFYGAKPESLAQAAQVIEKSGRFDLIDINCGCPVPKVVKRGAGVALMREPRKIYDIVKATIEATSLPVTVKTRIGLSPDFINISEVAHAAEEAGARAIFLHGRHASARHAGQADWETLRRVKEERAIPVIGNGGIDEAHHAAEMMQQTGVDGVMVGRAAIGNPWIFKKIYCHWTGKPYTSPTSKERLAVVSEHLDRLHELIEREVRRRKKPRYTSEQAACHKFRAHLVGYLSGTPNLRALRRNLMQMDSKKEVIAAVERIMLHQR